MHKLLALLLLSALMAGCSGSADSGDDPMATPDEQVDAATNMTASVKAPDEFTCQATVGAGAGGNSVNVPVPPVSGVVDPVGSVGGCNLGTISSKGTVTTLEMPDGCTSFFENDSSNQFTDGEAAVGTEYPADTQFGMYCDSGAVMADGRIVITH